MIRPQDLCLVPQGPVAASGGLALGVGDAGVSAGWFVPAEGANDFQCRSPALRGLPSVRNANSSQRGNGNAESLRGGEEAVIVACQFYRLTPP
jgi:hypothetical protein